MTKTTKAYAVKELGVDTFQVFNQENGLKEAFSFKKQLEKLGFVVYLYEVWVKPNGFIRSARKLR